eukprot:scaffold71827_cov14-Tisochrysis_lutea.AAC.3
MKRLLTCAGRIDHALNRSTAPAQKLRQHEMNCSHAQSTLIMRSTAARHLYRGGNGRVIWVNGLQQDCRKDPLARGRAGRQGSWKRVGYHEEVLGV